MKIQARFLNLSFGHPQYLVLEDDAHVRSVKARNLPKALTRPQTTPDECHRWTCSQYKHTFQMPAMSVWSINSRRRSMFVFVYLFSLLTLVIGSRRGSRQDERLSPRTRLPRLPQFQWI